MGRIEAVGMAKRGFMHTLDGTGDTTVIWESDDDESVVKAGDVFRQMSDQGYTAVKTDSDQEAVRIEGFDPEAERIVFIPQFAGG